MDVYMVVLRLAHVVAGVFWAGSAFMLAGFVLPTVREAGPTGGQFMQRLASGKLMPTLSATSGLTVLSGLLMYWRASGGLQLGWIGSASGLAFTVGGLAGLAAFLEGILIAAPTAKRLEALGREVAGSGGQPSPEQGAELQRLQGKLVKGAEWAAILLVVAVVGMAVARYL